MQTKIKIFESGIADGIMSTNKKFYSEITTEEQIKELFLETRKKLGKKHNFDGKKIIQALQKTETNNIDYPNGTYHIVTEKDLEFEDLWDLKTPADILLITSDYKNIVIGNQMADCPILIIEDRNKGVTALSHCGASYINRRLPEQTIEALLKEFDSNPEDLYVYVGSCIKKESYIYDKYPTWATDNDVWDEFIIEKNDNYHIDLEGAIIKQIEKYNIKNIKVSPYDTATDDIHYSHRASAQGNQSKKGQNFVGFYYI